MKKLPQILLFFFINLLIAQQDYTVFNTSINSEYAEFGVTYLSNNMVLFASSKKNKNDKSFKKNRRRNNRQLHLELYKGLIAENGDIIEANKFTDNLNNKFFESDVSFSPDFKTIYFIWNNFYDTQKRKDSAKWKPLYLFKASISEGFELSNITPLPFNSKNYSIRNPEVSKDGKQLFFASDMPNGFGGFDIYVVDIHENGFGWPRNLGSNVNTKHAELFPFISKNNTLYFSSDRNEKEKKLDIFKSEFKSNNFQKAINLPYPFNSKFDDFAFVIDSTLNTGYFTSNRDNGIGGVDIYAFKKKE